MKTNLILFIGLMTSMFMTGCEFKAEEIAETKVDNAIADSVELAVSSFAAMGDEQGNESLSDQAISSSVSAQTSLCEGRAVTQSCISGLRVKNYYECSVLKTNQTLNGYISLEYSDFDCLLSDPGETVIRTFEKTRTTSWGAKIQTTSEDRVNFEGNTIGGGSLLTKVSEGYELEILGKHRLRTGTLGRSRLDISIKTSAPVFMSSLKRQDRVIDGGTFEVFHNLAKYKIILAPNNLEYTSTCCHPIAGSINITYEGSLSGEGVVEFNGCEDATVTRGSESHKIEFYSCE